MVLLSLTKGGNVSTDARNLYLLVRPEDITLVAREDLKGLRFLLPLKGSGIPPLCSVPNSGQMVQETLPGVVFRRLVQVDL